MEPFNFSGNGGNEHYGRHLTIIESYLMAPSIHAEACLNPKMKGGPFMDFGGGRLEEVEALQKKSLKKHESKFNLLKQ